MNSRRNFLKGLGIVSATGLVGGSTTLIPEANPQQSYIMYLDSISKKLDSKEIVDGYAVVEILNKVEPGVAWAYCRVFYLHDQMRKHIDGDKDFMKRLASFRGMRV